jgi:transcriptional regulator with XRE-family HTH domain
MTITIRLGARLRAARKAAGFKTSREFVKKYKVPASTYSQHESGARSPDDDMLKFYSDTFGVNTVWLKSGKGQPYSRISAKKINIMSEELIGLKHQISTINETLLTNILEEILKNHNSVPMRKIAKMAAKKYSQEIPFYSN